MRILIAVDGSENSEQAVRLVAALSWPSETSATLLSVVDPGAWIPPGPGVPEGGLVHENEVAAYYQGHRLDAAAALERAGLQVDSTEVEGRPADVIIETAKAVGADLVVLGSRGHGRIAALLLGSVSAAVVDRAPCSVLVARGTTVTRMVLAMDGSRSARSAARIVGSWSALDGVRITVVTVEEAARPWTARFAPTFNSRARRGGAPVLDAKSEAHRIAEDAVAGLARAGRSATADVRRGEVAAEIITVADEQRADLIAIGCHGRSRPRTFRLGSVARDVTLAGRASVMVVRARRAGNGRS